MSDFGELVLICGDFDIPTRQPQIPDAFKDLLVPGTMHHVLCTGNIISHQMEDFLRTLAPSVHIVRGDQDSFDTFPTLPEHKIIKIGDWRIGLTHGHQIIPWGNHDSLAALQRHLDCDILLSGHTHTAELHLYQPGQWFLNPGSVTGSYSVNNSSPVPSFVLLALKGSKAVVYLYQLINGELSVTKSEFSKE